MSELARARASLANIKRHSKEVEHQIVRKAVIGLAAGATGFAESKGLQLSYFGVPTKLGIATIAAFGAAMSRDAGMSRILNAVADAEVAAYAYAGGKAHSFVAGGGEI